MPRNFLQVDEMPGVREAIQIYQARDFRAINHAMNDIGTDESGAAGDQQFHAGE
jgi:hypothetical protein